MLLQSTTDIRAIAIRAVLLMQFVRLTIYMSGNRLYTDGESFMLIYHLRRGSVKSVLLQSSYMSKSFT